MSLEAAQALSGYKFKCLLVILSGLRGTVDRKKKKKISDGPVYTKEGKK